MTCVDCKNAVFSLGDVLFPKSGEVIVRLDEAVPADMLEPCRNQNFPDHLVPAIRYDRGFSF